MHKTENLALTAGASRPAGWRYHAYYAWYVVGVLAMVNVVAALDRFLMGVVLQPLKSDLGLTDTELGLIYGLGFALLYCFAGIPLGRVADRSNRRNLLLFGCTVWTVGTMLCAFAGSFSTLFAARLGVGLGEAALTPAAVSLIGAYVVRERMGLANGIFFSGATLGKSLAFIGGGFVLAILAASGGIVVFGYNFVPWQGLFLAATVPGIVAIVLLLTVREPVRTTTKGSDAKAKDSNLVALWAHVKQNWKVYALFSVAAVSLQVIALVLAGWMPSFMVRRFGLDVSQAAIYVGIAAMVAGPVGGFASDFLTKKGVRGPSPIIVTATLLGLIPISLFVFTSTENLVWAMLAYMLTHMMILTGGPQCYAGAQFLTPMRYRGLIIAIFAAVMTLFALGIGPLVVGLMSDYIFHNGDNQLGNAIAVTIVVFSVIGSVTGLMVRKQFDVTAKRADVN
jgi:MFS family permease